MMMMMDCAAAAGATVAIGTKGSGPPAPPSRDQREEVEQLLCREWALWVWIRQVVGGEEEEGCDDLMEKSPAGLCGILKDGLLLCQLVQTIRPSLATWPAVVHLPPILQQRSRLRYFLQACEGMGIPAQNRWAPSQPFPSLPAFVFDLLLLSLRLVSFTVDELYYHHNLPKLLYFPSSFPSSGMACLAWYSHHDGGDGVGGVGWMGCAVPAWSAWRERLSWKTAFPRRNPVPITSFESSSSSGVSSRASPSLDPPIVCGVPIDLSLSLPSSLVMIAGAA